MITDKSRLRTFRRSACERLAGELTSAKGGLCVVHGAGSFGHILAKKHSLHKGLSRPAQIGPVARVQRDVRELDLRVIGALIDCGLNAVSVPPAAAARFDKGSIISFSPDRFTDLLDIGLVPVTFGDVVPDSSMGFSICSGDLMMARIAKAFKPRLVIFCADVDGVFDRDPKRDRRASAHTGARQVAPCRRSRRTAAVNADVTGSIFGKLERMLAIARELRKVYDSERQCARKTGEGGSGAGRSCRRPCSRDRCSSCQAMKYGPRN